MSKSKTRAATVLVSAALAGVLGGCQQNAEPSKPPQSTKQGTGAMKEPAGMERPMPKDNTGSTVTPVESTKTGSGQMKTPAGMERPMPADLPKPAATDLTHVLTKDTPYYTSSPAQGKPAEGTFKSGTKLLLLMPSGTYAQVWTDTGMKAYVPTANLQALGK